MPSIWPQRRNPLEERVLRRRRTPASALPGLGECNLLINDNDQSKLLTDDGGSGDILRLDGGAFAAQPVLSVASMVELQQVGNPEGFSSVFRYDVHWKQDGTRVWTHRNNGLTRQYDVSPAWSVSPGDWTLSNSQDIVGGSSAARTLEWSPDGTVMTSLQIWFSSFRRLVSWDQSATPFDMTVLGAAVVKTGIPGAEFGLHWRPDGLVLYIDRSARFIDAYPLTVPFDITTLILTPLYTFDSGVDAGARSMTMAFSSDGTKFYSVTSGALLCEWTCSTPYDLSTAGSFVTGVNVNAGSTIAIPRGLGVRFSTGHLYLFQDQNAGGNNQEAKVFG